MPCKNDSMFKSSIFTVVPLSLFELVSVKIIFFVSPCFRFIICDSETTSILSIIVFFPPPPPPVVGVAALTVKLTLSDKIEPFIVLFPYRLRVWLPVFVLKYKEEFIVIFVPLSKLYQIVSINMSV